MENISKIYIDRHYLDEGLGLGLLALLYLSIIVSTAIKIGFNRRAAERIANELLPIIKKDLDSGIKKASPKIATIGMTLYKTITSHNEWKQLLTEKIFWGLDDWKRLVEKNKYEDFLHLYIARSMKNALYISKGKNVPVIGLQNFFTKHFGMVTYDDTYDAIYRVVKRRGIPEDTPTFEMTMSRLTTEVDNMINAVLKADDKVAKILKPIYKLFFDNLERMLKKKADEQM